MFNDPEIKLLIQIFLVVGGILTVYYIVTLGLDIIKATFAKPAENRTTEEAIDVSNEFSSFASTGIKREKSTKSASGEQVQNSSPKEKNEASNEGEDPDWQPITTNLGPRFKIIDLVRVASGVGSKSELGKQFSGILCNFSNKENTEAFDDIA